MAGNLRKSWQAFKKAHPAFEKSKAFKSDVGPQLDKFDKGCEELTALREATEKKAVQLVTIGKSVAAALKGYEAVVKELQDSDKTIMKDYKELNFEAFEALKEQKLG
jgi:septal ring factor EnvC (AmiA/AmiB activator)